MITRLVAVGWIAVVVFVATGAAQQRRLPEKLLPVDEGPKDPSFVVFRSELIKAARAQDLAKVRSMMVPQPNAYDTMAEDAPGNLRVFSRLWKLNTAPQYFYGQLVDVLEHGGRFYASDHFVAPYWYAAFPGEGLDYMHYTVVIREAAPVFAKEDARSKPIAVVSYALLRSFGGLSWHLVDLPDGRSGFIHEKDVREPSGARAHFRKVKGVWKLAIFAEGMD